MNIKTKFNINDLVCHKYEVLSENEKILMEVMEIQPITCSAGTQVFYLCRALFMNRLHMAINPETGEKEYVWNIAHALTTAHMANPYQRYREDEIIQVPADVVNLIKNKG